MGTMVSSLQGAGGPVATSTKCEWKCVAGTALRGMRSLGPFPIPPCNAWDRLRELLPVTSSGPHVHQEATASAELCPHKSSGLSITLRGVGRML